MKQIIATNFMLPQDCLEFCSFVQKKEKLYLFEAKKDQNQINKKLKNLYRKGNFIGVKPSSFLPKALFLDMDDTTIKEESLDLLIEKLRPEDGISTRTEEAMQGKISFDTSFYERIKLLEGVKKEEFSKLFSELNLHLGIKELCSFFQKNKIPIFLVSGGLSFFCEFIAKAIGASNWHANQPELKKNILTGKILGKIVNKEEKKIWFYKICEENNIPQKETIMIGDGANDKEILSASGLPVGFMPRKALHEEIAVFNGTLDHRVFLDFLNL